MWLQQRGSTPNSALITGGTAGLGLDIAYGLKSRGFDVLVCGRTPEAVSAAKAAGLKAMRADVASAEDRAALMAWVEAQTGAPADLMINNAAITRAHDYTSARTLESDHAREEIEINLAAPIELGRLWLAARRRLGLETPGAIVNVGTPGALFPLEAIPLYCSTKAALHMFTEVLRRQMRGTPVKVMEVFPPALDTNLAHELNVASQAANGPEVIKAVAEETIEGILAGHDVILPHREARALFDAVPQLDPAFVDMVNSGVRRRADAA